MYCTKAEMIARYGETELIQLTDRARVGVIDDGVLDQARADAAAEIDGYLATRYRLPLADLPPSLVRVAAEIARYHLYHDQAPEEVKERYDNAVRFLRAVAKGEITLVRPAGDEPATAGDAEFVPGRHTGFGGGY